MAEANYGGGATAVQYPYTKMNFLVRVGDLTGIAAFTEVTGIDASVDVVEFRQGNSDSLAPLKIPGLVKHGNISLKFGITRGQDLRNWIADCISEQRGPIPRCNVTIELIDTIAKAPAAAVTTSDDAAKLQWVLTNAWVAKYSGADLNATTSEVAIETIELAYEEISTIPLPTA
ncbi:MAG: phage tail protein [Clostridiales Family XIII bacterium]|jgi:phage tail-like protein|nr:phage tail protein [Clostridiales Family XIII bacterium]